jgi:hypothetical protein
MPAKKTACLSQESLLSKASAVDELERLVRSTPYTLLGSRSHRGTIENRMGHQASLLDPRFL